MHIRLPPVKTSAMSSCFAAITYTLYKEAWYQQRIEMKILSTDLHDYWQVSVGAEFRRLSYGFSIESYDGLHVFMETTGLSFEQQYLEMNNNYFRMPYFQEADRFKIPEWAKETVWYQIFPERFANGDPSNDPEGVLPWGSKIPIAKTFSADLQGSSIIWITSSI